MGSYYLTVELTTSNYNTFGPVTFADFLKS